MSRDEFYLAVDLLKKKKRINQNKLAAMINTEAKAAGLTKVRTIQGSYITKYKQGQWKIPPQIKSLIEKILRDQGLLERFNNGISKYKAPPEKVYNSSSITNKEVANKYDLFLSVPKISLQNKIERHIAFNKELIELINKHTPSLTEDSNKLDQFKKKLRKSTQQRFFGRELVDEKKESELFNTHVLELYNNLSNILELNVCYPRQDLTLEEKQLTGHAPTDFESDYNDILASKGYLIVSPYPRLFTSAWIGLAIALSFNKPILAITSNQKKDVPYIISSEIGNRNFMHHKISSIDKIPHLSEFVKKNFLSKLA